MYCWCFHCCNNSYQGGCCSSFTRFYYADHPSRIGLPLCLTDFVVFTRLCIRISSMHVSSVISFLNKYLKIMKLRVNDQNMLFLFRIT